MIDDDFSLKLIKWYSENKRNLPWRESKSPYKIWISEIILQQTKVDQGLPYYLKFIKKFPNVHDLAIANENMVLKLLMITKHFPIKFLYQLMKTFLNI